MNHRRFILIAIETFLNAELHPAAIHETLAAKPQPYWEHLFEAECKSAVRVLKELRYQISTADCTRHKQLVYVDVFGIIGLLKMFEKTQSDNHRIYPPHSLYTAVIPFLETVVKYIESTGSDFMEPMTLVPDDYLQVQAEEIRLQHLVLRAKLKSKEIDPGLQHIINGYLDDFLSHKHTRYRQLQYTRNLTDALLELLSVNKSVNWTARLINKLVRLNFNQPAFYKYCVRTIAAAVQQEESTERKCSCLRWHVKELKNLMPKPLMALDPDSQSLRKLLLAYLSAELDYLELKPVRIEAAPLKPKEPAAGEIKKLRLNASMRLLVIAIQCLLHGNYLQPEKGGIKNILQFFADHFSTIGAETLSVQSLQKRISEKNETATLAILDVLEDMVSTLKASLGS
jgi:hypothetical protein